ncbi:MAG: transglutaminase family protein [Verrucomicrobiales bacterium]|nr:transglutaminase family protein [Verrucomicrobiales bacterium]
MKLSIQGQLDYYVEEPGTLLFAIRCPDTSHQRVVRDNITLSENAVYRDSFAGPEGNRFTSVYVSEPGDFSLTYEAEIETSYTLTGTGDVENRSIHELPDEVLPYLFPSRYASGDKLRNAAFDLFGVAGHPLQTAVAIEQWLNGNLHYQVGASTEHSSAVDTFVSRTGVCRDFSHLGIAFCRALNIPARYVSVYSPDLSPQDFHAVFEVYAGGNWFLFDATRQVPLNRISRIATGRDAGEVAAASIFGRVTSYGISVSVVEISGESDAPLHRGDLEEAGNAIRII